MLEDYEGINSEKNLEVADSNEVLSDSKIAYLQECMSPASAEALVDRIDELGSDVPPKAIDSNAEIAELIEPVKDQIDSKYLEAPNDFEQVEMASDAMLEINGTRYDEWVRMTPSERLAAMQKVEDTIAEIAHRPACEVRCEQLGKGHYGYYDPSTKTITLNSRYLESGLISYKETLDTIVHEGRHAYQDYNLTERQVHTSPGDLTNWRVNHDRFGYQSSQVYGAKLYWMQPVEADARKFAEDVFTKFSEKA